MPGLGPTPITHEGRLAADFATPLRGQPELPSASFNVFLRPTQTEESRDDGLQSFVRMKKTGEPTEFRRLSPSDGQGELFYYKIGWLDYRRWRERGHNRWRLDGARNVAGH